MSGTPATCPACGTVAEADPARRDAADFCPRCDYPLFWARAGDVAVVAGGDGHEEGPYRRAPGAVGADAPAPLPCPACAELNPLGSLTCWRCGAGMEPEPPVVPVDPPPVVADPEPAAAAEPEQVWGWWLVLSISGIVVALTLAGWVPW